MTKNRTPQDATVSHRVGDDTSVSPESSAPEYRVWSQRELRWMAMTFIEYQAWLTRPDLDPAEFASGEVVS